MDITGSFIGQGLIVLFLAFVVMWLILPFIVSGTNKRLDKIIAQNRELIRQQERVAEYSRAHNDGRSPPL